jgi:uncharacterized protein with gpF-like domain
MARVERQFKGQLQAEIARASNVMIGQYAASGNVRGDDIHQRRLEAIFQQMYARSVRVLGDDIIQQGKALGRQLETKDFAQHFVRMAQEFMARWGAEKVVQISNTTRNTIARGIAQGQREGLGVRGIADLIRSVVPATYAARAEVIARTEVHSAANFGANEAAKETGLTLRKEWVSAAGERTRDSHTAADGQIVAMDEPFNVDGESLEFPGDPAGSPENVINCRCSVAHIVVD